LKNNEYKRTSKTSKRTSNYLTKFEVDLLLDMKQGLMPRTIIKSNKYGKDFKYSNLSYYLNKFKKSGLILKVGYGTWELTEKAAKVVTTSKVTRGGCKTPENIELWGSGHRFFIWQDAIIKELKTRALRNGGYVSTGRVEGCWVTKGKEFLNIKTPVFKGPNLLEAHTHSANQVRNCYDYLTRRYGIVLYPHSELKCDIILGTKELRAVAKDVDKKFGRIRTAKVDIDKSKTGKPEFEVHNVKDAGNVLDNVAALSRINMIDERLYWFSVNLQKHEQVLNNMDQRLLEIANVLKEILGGRKK